MKFKGEIDFVNGMTKGQLIEAMRLIPETACLRINVTPGDRPWDVSQSYIIAEWESK